MDATQGEEDWDDRAAPANEPGDRAVFASPLFACLTIVGVGLMGGSLGLALRRRGLVTRIVGVDRNQATIRQAKAMGVIDFGTTALSEAVQDSDGVVLATPVGMIPALMAQIAPYVRPDALITDLGSTKARIVESGRQHFGDRFVGGHPMAGREIGGLESAQTHLFEGATWAIVSPSGESESDWENSDAVQKLSRLVQALGAHPLYLEATRHDRAVALVSHLPHMLSFAFAATVADWPDAERARLLAAGSYRDLMRVSAADRALWKDIFQDNRAALHDVLDAYQRQLAAMRALLLSEDQ